MTLSDNRPKMPGHETRINITIRGAKLVSVLGG